MTNHVKFGEDPVVMSDLGSYSTPERVGIFFVNWALMISAPVWAPIAFWHFVLTGKYAARNLLTGRRIISDE